jgi:hypothetical protein
MIRGSTVASKLPFLAYRSRIFWRSARPALYFGLDIIVAEPLVALKRHSVHQRILGDRHDQHIALAAELHVRKKAGGEQRLDAAIEPVRIERVAWPDEYV